MIPSLVNTKTMIGPHDWAVTLTCDFQNHHARIIFEGMSDYDPNSYFFRVAELTGKFICNSQANLCNSQPNTSLCACSFSKVGNVRLTKKKQKNEFNKKYFKKSQTWVRSKEKIKLIISTIKTERKSGVPFNICGGKSIFSKKAEIYEIYDQVLGSIAQHDKDLFLCLYDSAENGGEYTGMNKKAFEKSIEKVLLYVNKCFLLGDLGYSDLIQMVSLSSIKIDQSQQNCFTWARDKLSKIDVELFDIDFESVISITNYMTKYNSDDEVESFDTLIHTPIEDIPQQKKVYERFVTYNTNRDKRTIEWKVIDKKSKRNKVIQTILVVGAAGIFCAGAVAAYISAPVTVPMIVIGGTVLTFSAGVQGLIHKNQKKIINVDIKERKKALNQPGNKRLNKVV